MIEGPLISMGWESSSAQAPPRTDCVDIWRVRLEDANPDSTRFLSAGERLRADRFYSPTHRSRWIACRAALRSLLGRYLGIAPEDVMLDYSSTGKPMVSIGDLRQWAWSFTIEFNVSHSDEFGLIAIASGNAVGIDIEQIDRRLDLDGILEAALSTDESAYVTAVDPSERTARFFELWTKKEAWLKMVGCGLIDDMPAYSVLRPSDLPDPMRPAQILTVDVGESYRAAVCGQRRMDQVRKYEYRWQTS